MSRITNQTILEYKVILVPLSKIKLDPDNPNHMSREKMEGLRKVMKKYGYLQPVVLDKNYIMVDGEHRFIIYKEFGKKKIPALVVTECKTQTDRRILRQILNKLRGEHDKEKDANELRAIFENKRLDEFAAMIAEPIAIFRGILQKKFNMSFAPEENEIPPVPKVPTSKPGEIYKLGKNHILCGDSTDAAAVQAFLGTILIDQVLTDPPYGVSLGSKNTFLQEMSIGNVGHKHKRIEKPIEGDQVEDYRKLFADFLKLVPFAKYNTVYVFMSGKELHHLRLACDDADITWGDYLVWIKNAPVFGRKDYFAKHEFILYGWKGSHKFYGDYGDTLLPFDKPMKSKLHPTMKPTELLVKLVRDGSPEKGIIYDPFLGSGSTLIAAEQEGRICYGIEKDPGYVDVIIARWEQFTGQKAEKVKTVG